MLVGLSMSVVSTSTIFLTFSWRLEKNSTATGYTISYSTTNTDCFSHSNTISGIAGNETMYTLTGLEEGNEYFITVNVTFSSGNTTKVSKTATTTTDG